MFKSLEIIFKIKLENRPFEARYVNICAAFVGLFDDFKISNLWLHSCKYETFEFRVLKTVQSLEVQTKHGTNLNRFQIILVLDLKSEITSN